MSGPIGFVMKLQKLYPFRQTAEQVQDAQERRLRALLRHAVAHSPFYRKKYAGIDIERCFVEGTAEHEATAYLLANSGHRPFLAARKTVMMPLR